MTPDQGQKIIELLEDILTAIKANGTGEGGILPPLWPRLNQALKALHPTKFHNLVSQSQMLGPSRFTLAKTTAFHSRNLATARFHGTPKSKRHEWIAVAILTRHARRKSRYATQPVRFGIRKKERSKARCQRSSRTRAGAMMSYRRFNLTT